LFRERDISTPTKYHRGLNINRERELGDHPSFELKKEGKV